MVEFVANDRVLVGQKRLKHCPICVEAARKQDGFFRPEAKGSLSWIDEDTVYVAYSLPYPVANDKVQATLKHGVLTIILAKVEETKPRRITVKAE